jgi:Secretion system C-terminal sorting domain
LRRILTILSIILLIASQSTAQSSRPVDGPGDKIVKLYPNPATDYITFDFQGSGKKGLTVSIYSGVIGKKMYESSNATDKLIVNLNEFSRGVYIYHITDNTGRIVESGKFQVSR